MTTNFNKSNKYIATNVRNNNDTRTVRIVSHTLKGITFEDINDGFTFFCEYIACSPWNDNMSAIDVRRNGSHYKVNTKSAH